MSTATATKKDRPSAEPVTYTQADFLDVELKRYGQGHRYYAKMKDGKSIFLTRVTTITGILGSEALLKWAARMAADYAAEHVLPNTPYAEHELYEIWEGARQAHEAFRQAAADIGTQVHDIVERFLNTGRWPAPAEMVQLPSEVQNALANWMDWWNAQELEVVETERMVCNILPIKDHPLGNQLAYGGKLDAILRDPKTGELILLDWKTGSGIWPEQKLQVAGYALACARMGLPKISRAIICRVGKHDARFHVENVFQTGAEARELAHAFLDLVKVAKFLREEKNKMDRAWRARKSA